MSVRHFLTLLDLNSDELRALIERAIELKTQFKAGLAEQKFQGYTLVMIFDKSSTRTRLSFEVAMTHFGGRAIFLSPGSTQLGRGEALEDTARVMSRMVEVVVIRTSSHSMVEKFAEHSQVPVVNGLTDRFHPCQLLADIQTYTELRGDIRGRKVAWVGDGNNVCNSWINAALRFDFSLCVATPRGYHPEQETLRNAGNRIAVFEDPMDAVRNADIVVTDTWASMGQEEEKEKRVKAFENYRVDQKLMRHANSDAVFMHCLPAYRGFEVTTEVIDGPQSVVWDQAENRLHAQKALLEYLLRA